jgi:hypothetical protein
MDSLQKTGFYILRNRLKQSRVTKIPVPYRELCMHGNTHQQGSKYMDLTTELTIILKKGHG